MPEYLTLSLSTRQVSLSNWWVDLICLAEGQRTPQVSLNTWQVSLKYLTGEPEYLTREPKDPGRQEGSLNTCVRHRPGPEWGTWGNPQELNWFLLWIKPLRRTRSLRDPEQTQVWSEQVWLDTTFISQGSRSWGKLAVETWRVKTELIIITILHITITKTSILNLGFKTIAPKILAHPKMDK